MTTETKRPTRRQRMDTRQRAQRSYADDVAGRCGIKPAADSAPVASDEIAELKERLTAQIKATAGAMTGHPMGEGVFSATTEFGAVYRDYRNRVFAADKEMLVAVDSAIRHVVASWNAYTAGQIKAGRKVLNAEVSKARRAAEAATAAATAAHRSDPGPADLERAQRHFWNALRAAVDFARAARNGTGDDDAPAEIVAGAEAPPPAE